MLRIRALTFDLDDTLWDNRPVMLAAEQALYDWLSANYPRIGQRYTLEELSGLRRDLAERDPRLRYHMTALRKASLRLAAESVGYDDGLVEPAFLAFLEVRHRVKPYDDVIPALERLRGAGYLIGSLTNGNADVHRAGIGHLFDFSVSAESAGRAKPHPRMFQEACRLAGIDPSELAHVGDEPATDLEGARVAEVAGIWMNRPGDSDNHEIPFHAEVRDMNQLLKLLGVDGPALLPA